VNPSRGLSALQQCCNALHAGKIILNPNLKRWPRGMIPRSRSNPVNAYRDPTGGSKRSAYISAQEPRRPGDDNASLGRH
jgi:hypothetical protein